MSNDYFNDYIKTFLDDTSQEDFKNMLMGEFKRAEPHNNYTTATNSPIESPTVEDLTIKLEELKVEIAAHHERRNMVSQDDFRWSRYEEMVEMPEAIEIPEPSWDRERMGLDYFSRFSDNIWFGDADPKKVEKKADVPEDLFDMEK